MSSGKEGEMKDKGELICSMFGGIEVLKCVREGSKESSGVSRRRESSEGVRLGKVCKRV